MNLGSGKTATEAKKERFIWPFISFSNAIRPTTHTTCIRWTPTCSSTQKPRITSSNKSEEAWRRSTPDGSWGPKLLTQPLPALSQLESRASYVQRIHRGKDPAAMGLSLTAYDVIQLGTHQEDQNTPNLSGTGQGSVKTGVNSRRAIYSLRDLQPWWCQGPDVHSTFDLSNQ